MKRKISIKRSDRVTTAVFALICGAVALNRIVDAAPLNSARVSQVIQDVRLLKPSAPPRPAVVNDMVTRESAVRTGVESRAELTFPDLTITRLGQNTIFTLSRGAREIHLDSGSLLLQIPPNAPEARIISPGVTAGIAGATALFAVGPPRKFMVLEGNGFLFPTGHPERAVHLQAGEMVMMTADGRITPVMTFNVGLVLSTSHLITDFPELANLTLILNIVNQQGAGFGESPGPPPYRDIIEVADQRFAALPTLTPSATPTPTTTPSPTPSKFGTPLVISSPVPYIITSGTTITTDPSITTNGVTAYGTIYRGPTADGPFTMWAFGSTRPFDTALNLDSEFFSDSANLPIAVFKFQSLSLTGNPTIDTSNGGVTRLGLIGVSGITSGPPGGPLTFSGLDGLYLGTVNGSINLSSDISFANLDTLAIYARGSGSSLTINSPISNIANLKLAAEGSLQLTNSGSMSVGSFGSTAGGNLNVQIHGSLSLDGQFRLDTLVLPGTSVPNGANVTLTVGNDFTNSSADDISQLRVKNENGHIGRGGNISMNVGGDLMTAGDFEMTVQNTSGQIDNGGNIALTTSGSVSTGGAFSVLVENYDFSGNAAGHIGTGGNISVATGGDLSAQSIIALVNNRSGGQIDSPVSLTLNVGGALTTSGESTDPFGFPESLSVTISTRFDNMSGPALASTIDGNATLTINAGTASIGGRLSTIISNTGSTLNGSALMNLGITNGVSIDGEADLEILNDADIASPLGGVLHGSATLQVLSNNFTANALFAQIDNRDGALIDSNAAIAFDLTGSFAIPGTNPGNSGFDATVPGEADILIDNQKRGVSQDNATSGGTIGGSALIQLSAASASIAGLFDVEIDNFNSDSGVSGGSIGSNAAIDFNITSSLQVVGDADFQILNESRATRSAGGTIGGDATIDVSAASISANSLLTQINNSNFGSIGGNATIDVTVPNISIGGNLFNQIDNSNGGTIGNAATINMNVSATATVTNDAQFNIFGSNGASSAAINFNGGNYSVGGMFRSTISDDGAIAFNNATVQADVLKAGVFGPNGVLNVGGGMLSGNTEFKLYASGSNGSINFLTDVTLSGQTAAPIIAANTVTIFDGVVVTITGQSGMAMVFANVPNYSGSGGNGSTTGTFGGNGAQTQSLSSAPPFDGPILAPETIEPSGGATSHHGTDTTSAAAPRNAERADDFREPRARTAAATINIRNSSQLLALLDDAVPRPRGKISSAAGHKTAGAKDSSRIDMADRLKNVRINLDSHRNGEHERPGLLARQ